MSSLALQWVCRVRYRVTSAASASPAAPAASPLSSLTSPAPARDAGSSTIRSIAASDCAAVICLVADSARTARIAPARATAGLVSVGWAAAAGCLGHSCDLS